MEESLILNIVVGDVEQLKMEVVLQYMRNAFRVVRVQLIVGETQLFECAIFV